MKATRLSMRLPAICLFGASLFFSSACKEEVGAGKAPGPIPSSTWPATQTTDGGNFEVTVQPEGGEIVRNQHFSLELKLLAKDGDLAGVTVAVDADMPAHQHGMNTKPQVIALDGGAFRAEGMLFHMAGGWVIAVDVTRGDETERASYPVAVE